MNLIEQLRNKIRGRLTDDVLDSIAKGVELELKRKYLCLTFSSILRPFAVEVTAFHQTTEITVVFTISFSGNDCALFRPLLPANQSDPGYFFQDHETGECRKPIGVFQYADPNMFDHLYKAIAELPGVPK